VDTTLKRTVALKVLAPHLLSDPTFVERFQREAEVAANLDHRNIVTIYEVGQIFDICEEE
jgi:serine/threonine-protein kinase